nr:alpha-ribazole phosphatase family protein [Marivita sp. GX14005]
MTLLRHTAPEVARGTCYGRTDLALAESFERDAEAVLRAIAKPSHLLTSPLARCRRLAEHIGAHLSLEPIRASDWIEMDFGAWEGTPWDAIPRHELDAWADDFHDFAGHGGESVAMLERRICAALEATPEGALVVTHAGCIKAACAILGVADGWQTQTPFGGMVRLP